MVKKNNVELIKGVDRALDTTLAALRVAVMLPLYLAGEVALLGVAKIGLGWPAYLLAIVVMGWLLATGRTPQTDDGAGARTGSGAPP